MTAALARFLAESRWEDIPEAIRREAKRALLNFLGCAIAGRSDPAVQLLSKTFPSETGLLVAASANAFDFDDTHLHTVIHPSAPVGGALFSLIEEKKISGAELLHAFVLGVEAACRVGNAVSPGHYERGWHITGTCGVFGAAAAAGKVLRLDEKQFLSALGIAATQAAGLVEMLGSMARILNTGFAARNGLAAALLAVKGFEAAERPLEGARGFVNVFGGANDLGALTVGLGKDWALSELAYKPYPCGIVLHSLIDACLEFSVAPESIERVVCTLHPLAIERGDRPEPRNATEARLSAQHAAAVALIHRAAGLEQFSDAAAADPAVAGLRRKVRLRADDRIGKAAAIVELRSSENPTVKVEVPHARGSIERPMSDAELEAKFRRLAGARAEELLRLVHSLESLNDAGRLAASCDV